MNQVHDDIITESFDFQMIVDYKEEQINKQLTIYTYMFYKPYLKEKLCHTIVIVAT